MCVDIYHTLVLPTFAQFVHPARALLLLSFCLFSKLEKFISTLLFDNLIFFSLFLCVLINFVAET